MSLDAPPLAMETLAPLGSELGPVFDAAPLPPFAPQVLELLAALSARLLSSAQARAYPDVITFGFWCRRASLAAMAGRSGDARPRLGRGVVFHVAPGNVPVNFAYSMAAGLLAGNANVVRLPSADFPQVAIIAAALDEVLSTDPHRSLRDRVLLVRYDKLETAVTDALSRRCDVRVIWGGDRTIDDIRTSPLSSRAFDITFADRYSICVIGAEGYLEGANHRQIADGFYNDTYLFDQNACTAPHLVVWIGADDAVAAAKAVFWRELHAVAVEKYELQTVSAVDKLTIAYRFAARHEHCHIPAAPDNIVTRMELDVLDPDIDEWRGNCGYFAEYHATGIGELSRVVTERYQTIAYVGVPSDELRELVVGSGLHGIDRIVPIGRTLDFSLDWDGYDLIASLSRVLVVQ